ncbi:hypothetical protein QBC47DRAFT_296147 [Echria macrotheca]|uniref:Zn(2)-C6 fungal-type domain-containing protein n=1 Tax=Echria macrotheca TaxID=438768 RepID=A0AAJ0BGN4_9PEZI|nr:hypothetical protein QBC47DRAFT_296147 [Echria macrotheca]
MLRRSHKKSRAGCLECKRRHVKCDEQRPKCIICTLSERPCSYPPGPPPGAVGDQQRPVAPSPEGSSTTSHTSQGNSPPGTNAPNLPVSGELQGIAAETPLYRAVTAEVNLDHLELMVKFNIIEHFPDVEGEMLQAATDLHNAAMLQAPYYAIEILALSARRLAVSEPDRAEKFMAFSVSLQTKAIQLYNNVVSTVKLDNVNSSPIMQFASALGRHLLPDLWARRDDDFNVYLDHYVEFVKIHTGIKLITHAAWPFLLDSGMKTFMLWAAQFHLATPIGSECEPLHLLLANAGLDAVTLEASRTALRTLQIGFDMMQAKERRPSRYLVIYSWSVAAPPEWTELLVQRRPEAIVVLAYFGVILHWSRNIWAVGEAGSYLINSVARHLGPDWEPYLAYPLSVLSADPL